MTTEPEPQAQSVPPDAPAGFRRLHRKIARLPKALRDQITIPDVWSFKLFSFHSLRNPVTFAGWPQSGSEHCSYGKRSQLSLGEVDSNLPGGRRGNQRGHLRASWAQ